LIAFLAIANDLAVLIFSDALFHIFAASIVKLFLACADPPLSVRSPQEPPLVSMPSPRLSRVFHLYLFIFVLAQCHLHSYVNFTGSGIDVPIFTL